MAKPPEKSLQPSDRASDEVDAFAEELAKRLNSIVPHAQRAQVVAQVVSLVSEERFSGPICHPKHLREYDEVLPGSADRIIRMAESNLAHAQAMQEIALNGDIQDIKDGRRYGFFALVLLITGAIVCGVAGMEALALAFLGAGALGTIGAFIKGKNGG